MTFSFDALAHWPVLLGCASAVLSTLAFAPYVRDTLRGDTTPQRASWLIWSVLSAIAFASQVFEGATTSLLYAGAQVTGTLVIFCLALGRGQGALLSRPDERVLWIAALGLVVWYFTETAVYALALTITISLLGGTLTIRKAYLNPNSETLSCWAISFVAACCAIGSVGAWDPVLLAYPLYLFVLNGLIVLAIVAGRGRMAQTV